MLVNTHNITYEDFLEIDNKSEEYLEYIDGQIYNQASPQLSIKYK